MATGRGPSKPGTRGARPGASRPLRSPRGAKRATSAGMPSASAGSSASAGGAVGGAAGWRTRWDRARSDQRSVRVLAAVAVALALVVLVGSTLKHYVDQRQEISRLQEQVAAQEKRVADLQAEQDRWKDPAYVEQQARQRLKFVKVGERSYTVLDPQTPAAEVPGMAPGESATAWYSSVWASIHAADAPAAAR